MSEKELQTKPQAVISGPSPPCACQGMLQILDVQQDMPRQKAIYVDEVWLLRQTYMGNFNHRVCCSTAFGQ